MDGFQVPQGYRATTRRHFTFYHRVTIDLKFPQKLLLFFNSQVLIANKWFEEGMRYTPP